MALNSVSVDFRTIGEHENLEWTAKREEIAKAFSIQGAHSLEDAVAARDIHDMVGGDYSNLRKILEGMPGVVKVLPRPYKTKMQQTWYYLPEFKEAAHANSTFYPINNPPELKKRFTSVQVLVKKFETPEDVYRIYASHHGSTDGRTVAKKNAERVESGPQMHPVVAEFYKGKEELFEPFTILTMKESIKGYYDGKPEDFTKEDAKTLFDKHDSMLAAIYEITTHVFRKANKK